MSLLIFAFRKQEIIKRKSDLEFRLMTLTRKLEDLQHYATNIADGSISMSDMMNSPGSMFTRQMMFMQYSHNTALMGAQQNMAFMQPQIQMQMAQMQDPNMQMQYQQWIFRSLYQQQREVCAKREQKLLNEQEKEIQKEKTSIETQIKMLEQEYESCKQGESDGIKFFKPEFTGG